MKQQTKVIFHYYHHASNSVVSLNTESDIKKYPPDSLLLVGREAITISPPYLRDMKSALKLHKLMLDLDHKQLMDSIQNRIDTEPTGGE
jgi:hypothetical protein